MNINKKYEELGKKHGKNRRVPAKFLIFQLPIALEYQTWYQSKSYIHPYYLMIKYLNYLIIIIMKINENIIEERKLKKN